MSSIDEYGLPESIMYLSAILELAKVGFGIVTGQVPSTLALFVASCQMTECESFSITHPPRRKRAYIVQKSQK